MRSRSHLGRPVSSRENRVPVVVESSLEAVSAGSSVGFQLSPGKAYLVHKMRLLLTRVYAKNFVISAGRHRLQSGPETRYPALGRCRITIQ